MHFVFFSIHFRIKVLTSFYCCFGSFISLWGLRLLKFLKQLLRIILIDWIFAQLCYDIFLFFISRNSERFLLIKLISSKNYLLSLLRSVLDSQISFFLKCVFRCLLFLSLVIVCWLLAYLIFDISLIALFI